MYVTYKEFKDPEKGGGKSGVGRKVAVVAPFCAPNTHYLFFCFSFPIGANCPPPSLLNLALVSSLSRRGKVLCFFPRRRKKSFLLFVLL